jgi:tRNA(fMet)-specific endonuclease VapC
VRVLDTDTCVEILRGNRSVIDCRAATFDEVTTNWITATELYFGAARSKDPEKNRGVVTQFLGTLEVIGIDIAASRIFGDTKAALQTVGQPLPDADILIGAIAIARDAVLVTGSTKHFARFRGLRLENWIR